MLHTIFIGAHTVTAIAAFVFGLVVLRPRVQGASAWFRLYLGALWSMILFLIVVVGIDWINLDLTSRSVFGALLLFGFYIGWRGWQALGKLRTRTAGWEGKYIDDIGFTLIALFDGFAIILALDLGVPIWGIIAIGVLGVVVGRYGVSRTKQSVARGESGSTIPSREAEGRL